MSSNLPQQLFLDIPLDEDAMELTKDTKSGKKGSSSSILESGVDRSKPEGDRTVAAAIILSQGTPPFSTSSFNIENNTWTYITEKEYESLQANLKGVYLSQIKRIKPAELRNMMMNHIPTLVREYPAEKEHIPSFEALLKNCVGLQEAKEAQEKARKDALKKQAELRKKRADEAKKKAEKQKQEAELKLLSQLANKYGLAPPLDSK